MIGKQIKGKGFLGVLKYVTDKDKGHLIGGNMDGETPQELSKEFAAIRRLNPEIKKPVNHVSLSLPPGERLNDFEWSEVAHRYMKEMGFENSQYVVARHTDAEHDHIHIVSSRIGLDGKTVSDSNNYRRSEKVIRQIEKDYDLQRVAPSQEAKQKGLTTGELRKALRTGEASVKMLMQKKLDEVAKRSLTMSDFARRVREEGIELIPNVAKTGRVTGLSFAHDGEVMKGSDLGKAYTFGGLQKRGVNYDRVRDLDAFKARLEPTKRRKNEKTKAKPKERPSGFELGR